MEKLVSIIVSVYNKEQYIQKCIESLINLKIDHNKIEAIFVDDCSIDNSVEIIESYANKYDFIQIIRLPKNTGSPSQPRNVGMKEAKGKYLTLLDADDWLDTVGFPEFIKKVDEDDAEFGLGQTYKHTNKNITYHANFTSYKDASGLKPEEIEKIFRAVGPPGKVFKRSIVLENQIEFEHMKFGEDKLFFIELISKIKDITMSTIPVYHVNRYDENISLVKETSVLDKAYLNQNITDRICKMDIPLALKELALSRMIEVDFFRRLLHTKTFLKSDNKQEFYSIFDEVEKNLEDYGFQIKDFLKNKVFIAMYELYHFENKDEFIKFTSDVVYGNWRFYIQNDVVYKTLEHNYTVMSPIAVDCYPIYEGTHLIDGEFFEIIKVLKPENINVKAVSLVEINNVLNTREVEFDYSNDRIYIKQKQFAEMEDLDVNISIEYGEMGKSLVYASYPSNNETYKMKRQSFKLEFINRLIEKDNNKYFTSVFTPMITLKKTKLYKDLEFKEIIQELQPGTKVVPIEIKYTLSGTPRLVLEDGSVLTANKNFVTTIDTKNHHKYITEIPNEVKVIKTCKLYDSRTFKNDPITTLKTGENIIIKNIIYTNNSTPCLVTKDGYYLTANKDFVEVI